MPVFRLKCTKFNFGWGSAQTLPLAGGEGPAALSQETHPALGFWASMLSPLGLHTRPFFG